MTRPRGEVRCSGGQVVTFSCPASVIVIVRSSSCRAGQHSAARCPGNPASGVIPSPARQATTPAREVSPLPSPGETFKYPRCPRPVPHLAPRVARVTHPQVGGSNWANGSGGAVRWRDSPDDHAARGPWPFAELRVDVTGSGEGDFRSRAPCGLPVGTSSNLRHASIRSHPNR